MKQRLLSLALHLAIFFALVHGYVEYMAPVYGYEGYLLEPNEANWYLGVLFTTLLSLITPVTSEKPSTIFYHLLLTTIVIPMLVLFYGENWPWEYIAQVATAYAITVFLPFFVKLSPPKFAAVSKDKLRIVLFLGAVFYIVMVLLMGGGAYLNFDLSKVYDFRHEAADNLPGIFGYVSPLIGKVVVPMGFVLSLLYRKYLMALMLLGASVLIFGLTAHKSMLFTPFLILFIYFASSGKNLALKFNAVALLTIAASIVDFWLWQKHDVENSGWVATLMMARIFFVPAQLNFFYYDFFSKNDWIWFSDSKLTLGFVDYGYSLDVPHLIGREYFHNEATGANTGWLGSGYMQAGFLGLIVYAIVIGVLFKYIDACARNSGERALVTTAMIVPVSVLMTSADMPTTFLTHGLIISLLLTTCFRRGDSIPARARAHPRRFAAAPRGGSA